MYPNQPLSLIHILLKAVVDVKGDQLTVSYSDVFDISKEMNDEIIFAIRYKSGSLGIGSPFANTFAPTKSGANVVTGDGDGRNYPTTEVLGIYPEGDLRKDASVTDHYIDPSKKEMCIRDRLDRDRLGNMAKAVTTLGIAYYFSGNEQYAKKATDFLKVWFLDAKTKMNPNLNYGQTIPCLLYTSYQTSTYTEDFTAT